jgi:hypothetical protein
MESRLVVLLVIYTDVIVLYCSWGVWWVCLGKLYIKGMHTMYLMYVRHTAYVCFFECVLYKSNSKAAVMA